MPKFKDPKKLAAYLKDASDALLAATVTTTQRELGSERSRLMTKVDSCRIGLLVSRCQTGLQQKLLTARRPTLWGWTMTLAKLTT